MANGANSWHGVLRNFLSGGILSIVLGVIFLFLSYVQHLIDDNLSAFVLLFGLLGVVIMLYGIVVQTGSGESVYAGLEKFFSSGIFYIALGAVFLWISYLQIDDTGSHPTFIFLLAILGVAIVLYGTGTQAAGETKTGTMNVVIAGGAGVLAMALGYGVVELNTGIQSVFSTARYYVVVRLEPDDNQASFDLFDISATGPDGEPLHLKKKNRQVEILVPVSHKTESTEVTVRARKQGNNKEKLPPLRQNYKIALKEKKQFVSTGKYGSDKNGTGDVTVADEQGPSVRFQISDVLVVPAMLVDSDKFNKLKAVEIPEGIDRGQVIEVSPQ